MSELSRCNLGHLISWGHCFQLALWCSWRRYLLCYVICMLAPVHVGEGLLCMLRSKATHNAARMLCSLLTTGCLQVGLLHCCNQVQLQLSS